MVIFNFEWDFLSNTWCTFSKWEWKECFIAWIHPKNAPKLSTLQLNIDKREEKTSKWSITKFKKAISCTFSLYSSNLKEIRKVATYFVFDCNPWHKQKRFYITMIINLDYDSSYILYNFDISQQLNIFVIGATSLSHICINHNRVYQ